jgi:putative transposase
MPSGLKRYYGQGHLHFITFSCYRRLPLLKTARARNIFVRELARVRDELGFRLVGYVVMPEHVHLLVSEPGRESLAVALQGLKLSGARRTRTRPFWLPRYYDFNVRTEAKRFEKLNYIHWNPTKRGLVDRPEDWRWSSYRYYQTGEQGRVTIKSW